MISEVTFTVFAVLVLFFLYRIAQNTDAIREHFEPKELDDFDEDDIPPP